MIMKTTPYKYRFIAQVTIECVTPLSVGTGESDFLTDSTVAIDCNGMPYIPGTAIAGVVRHALVNKSILGFWGKHDRGSQIAFSEARMIGQDGKVLDGLAEIPNEVFYEFYRNLPIRQHTAITEKGVAKEHCKFDEQVVPIGTRFRFEIEMLSKNENDYESFKQVLETLNYSSLRIGSGTRNGFGKIDVKECVCRKFDLSNKKDLDDYIQKSSSLNSDLQGDITQIGKKNGEAWVEYTLSFSPVNFFMFGSGYGDDEVDDVPVKENIVVWNNSKAAITKNFTLIPATSIKGALSHRVAYYYNKQVGNFADKLSRMEIGNWTGTKNDAVAALFGEDEDGKNKKIRRGNVLFEDVFICESDIKEQIFPHVKIDRFTGGTIDGALFQEKASTTQKQITMHIYVNKIVSNEARMAFESALDDLCQGALPLGGNVNKGHGCFCGKWEKK